MTSNVITTIKIKKRYSDLRELALGLSARHRLDLRLEGRTCGSHQLGKEARVIISFVFVFLSENLVILFIPPPHFDISLIVLIFKHFL